MKEHDSLDIEDNFFRMIGFKTSHRNFDEEDPWETENEDKYYNAQGILVKPDLEEIGPKELNYDD